MVQVPRGWATGGGGHASPYSFLPTVPQDSAESPGTIGLENLGRARLCPPERTLGKKKGSNSGCQTSDGAQHGDVPSWPSYSPLRCCYPGSPWWLRRAQVSCSLETPPRVKPAWSFCMGIITHTHTSLWYSVLPPAAQFWAVNHTDGPGDSSTSSSSLNPVVSVEED